MMTQFFRVSKSGIRFLLMGGLLIAGCQSVDRKQQSATMPGAVSSLSNYWASFSEVDELQVYVGWQGRGGFAVNLPAPQTRQGYELVYRVQQADESGSSDYLLDFESTSAATLCIGLRDGDVLQQADLYEADFTGQTPLVDGRPLRMFGFPIGWNGWTGAEPPERVAPVSINADAIPLYANATPLVTVMPKNPCEALPPTPTPASMPAPIPFFDVVVTVGSGGGTSDIAEFYVQEPGAVKKGSMFDDGTKLDFQDKTTGHADSILVDQSWTSGTDPFHMFAPLGTVSNGEYQAVVTNNWADRLVPGNCPATDPLPVTITVKTHTAQQSFTCKVTCDSGIHAAIAATFPSGAIQKISCP